MKLRARNPFPGVTRVIDRHGKVRWRFRMKGRPNRYLSGEYASAEFRAAYEQAVSGGASLPPISRAAYGTFDWLIEHYKRTPKWQKLAAISQRNLGNELDRFSREHGTKRITTLRLEHVEAIVAKKSSTPAAANRLLKLLRRLARFAIKKRVIQVDPTVGVERYTENPDGFHTWTDEEIARFEKHHGTASKAVLALRLILCTGAARQDVIRIGWQNVQDSRIAYRRGKTGGEVDLPILGELLDVFGIGADQSDAVPHPFGQPSVQGDHFRQLVSRPVHSSRTSALLIPWPAKSRGDTSCERWRDRVRDHGFPWPQDYGRGPHLHEEGEPQNPVRQWTGEGGEGKKRTSFVQPCQKVGHRSAATH